VPAKHSPADTIGVRTAIVHDWFQGYHGSEQVVHVMTTDLFAHSNPPDIYTFHAERELLPADLASLIVRESRVSRLPGIRQRGHTPGRWRYLLPYMPFYFDRLRLDEYDLVISSSHAFAKRLRVNSEALHVCYCYTPIRYLWLPEAESGRATGATKMALGVVRNRLKKLDRESALRPDGFVAISTAVRERIRRFYGRDAEVIHPPVDTRSLAPRAKDAGKFLWVNRLVAYKRPELVAEAFRELPYRLTMVGVGPLERRLRDMLPPNVELVGWLPRERLVELYAEAVGLIHVGEEDFGITMVEALASGTPVIAVNRGGARDIVRNGEDGVLVDTPTVESLRRAIHEVAQSKYDPRALVEGAERFSRAHFVETFRHYIEDLQKAK
jgi:glycosyltransferase involved in cell wall biosynthesis